MKIVNSIISFCFGVFFLLAIAFASYGYIEQFQKSHLKSIDVYFIILIGILFIAYSIQNMVAVFRRKKAAKKVRLFMLSMHIILLFGFIFFSYSQYQYMNPINLVIHLLVVSCLVFLSIYQFREITLSQQPS